MTREVALIGVPSGAGACGVGQHETPAALRAAGLLERLADAGMAVSDLGNSPPWPWRPDRTNRRSQNLGAVVEQVRTSATRVADGLAVPGRIALVLGGDCTIGIGGGGGPTGRPGPRCGIRVWLLRIAERSSRMSRLLLVGVLFVLAGLCEIGGGYLVWGWMRDNKPLLWALVGAVVLALYGVVAALQPISEFGRVYAAYGGIFIALSLAWGVFVDGFRPDRYDLLGALICIAGVVVMVAPTRG
jgi:small multidrug resistance family-3 protein